jgi:hypothetical protein
VFHSKIAMLFLIPLGLAAATEGIDETAASPQAPASEPEPAFDLHVAGFPHAGQPLSLVVTGPPATPFQVLVELRDGKAPFAGGRSAVIAGATDSAGLWKTAFRAPGECTELRFLGVAADPRTGSAPRAFDGLELTILAPYAPRPGDLVITEILRAADGLGAPRGPWVEVYNATDLEIDLSDWTLRTSGGRYPFPIARADLVVPGRGFAILGAEPGAHVLQAFDSFQLDPDSDEVVLEDALGTVIDRVAYEVSNGWPASVPGVSMQLTPDRLDARANDEPSAWIQVLPSAGQDVAVTSIAQMIPCAVDAVTDIPDLNFIDINCDGIDGDIVRAVFVSKNGLATNPGTMAKPLSSIQAAINLAAADPSRDHVYVSEGLYDGMVTLKDGVSVWGGYSQANGWARSNAYATILVNNLALPNGLVVVLGSGLSKPVTLGSVRVSSATAATDRSSYGILLASCKALTLEGVEVHPGGGGLGSNGSAGQTGSAGSAGKAGGGSTSCGYNYCAGAGGLGANKGGGGGEGGHTTFHPNGYTGAKGAGPAGGAGGAGGGWISAGLNGSNGGAGAAGQHASPSSNVGFITAGWWVSNGDGGKGASGIGGSGGGGAGGGSTDFFGTSGNGGGGGGGGGFPGSGGLGGRAGGSCFGVFLYVSHVTLESCVIAAGPGRPGGAGWAGGSGGSGGAGGAGGTCCSVPWGGKGGTGGKGGAGGAGAGGGGGHSYGILLDPFSTMTLSSTTVSASSGGAGGTSSGGASSNGKSGQSLAVKQL